MISEEDNSDVPMKVHRPKSIAEFFRESPLVGVELDLERDKDTGRDIELASRVILPEIGHIGGN
jgi:hypothetical protein